MCGDRPPVRRNSETVRMSDSGHLSKMEITAIDHEVAELLETGRKLHADLLETIRTRTQRGQVGTWTPLSPALEKKYETWYSLSLRLIQRVLPERADDFRTLYKSDSGYSIHGYLTIGRTRGATQVASRFQNQIALLRAVQTALGSVLSDLLGVVQADFFDSELDVAGDLLQDGLLRPAGVVAGVVLERHLISVCSSHGVSTGNDVSISRLNDALKKAGVLDLADWRRIQLLGDLRNKCSHPKQKDPTVEDVTDLLDGVAKVIKRVF